jgi:hypothetical protein
MEVLLFTVMDWAAIPPMVTWAPGWKPEPEIETDVPPVVTPELGDIPVTATDVLALPFDLCKIVLSFFNGPGAVLRYVEGDSTIWSMERPSSRVCILMVCTPVVEK